MCDYLQPFANICKNSRYFVRNIALTKGTATKWTSFNIYINVYFYAYIYENNYQSK